MTDENIFGDDDIVFLTIDQVISLHEEGIKRYSPTESLSIFDTGLLESAVMTPQQTFDAGPSERRPRSPTRLTGQSACA